MMYNPTELTQTLAGGTNILLWFGGNLIKYAVITGVPTYVSLTLLLAYLKKRHILDHPNHRSLHAVPTPRGGGIAIMVGLLPAWWDMIRQYSGCQNLPQDVWFQPCALPLIAIGIIAYILAAFSFWDDVKPLPAQLKLLFQAVMVGIAITLLPPDFFPLQILPQYLGDTGGMIAAKIIIGILWLWFVNLYNFMDGSDGMTAIETAFLGLAIALSIPLLKAIQYFTAPEIIPIASPLPLAALSLALAMASLAFLRFNWHPAQVFLGDVGSIPLGFLLGFLLIGLVNATQWPLAIILPLYYWADSGVTLARRMVAGEKFWLPHRSHYYQRAVLAGASHGAVAKHVFTTNLGLFGFAILALILQDWLGQLAVIAVATLWVAWRMREMLLTLPRQTAKPSDKAA
ncbi:MAG: glycosyltransferase family 4 protein [Candidatus Symbiobacter sp.]|nr:glycosyltransferase family 4 protein [Candidatus Symbiobacter sp.]